jgi:hypothetical protein
MTVTRRPPGTPLPDNHPFKGGMIIFGGRRPVPPAPPQPETNLDQVAHDQRMVQQTLDQRATMVRGLGALARSKLEPDAGHDKEVTP